jgi:hypothetical protein
VSRLVSEGVSRKEIARRLGVSVSTVHADMLEHLDLKEKSIHQIARELRQEMLEDLLLDRARCRRALAAAFTHLDEAATESSANIATTDFPGFRLLAATSLQLGKQVEDFLTTTVAQAPREDRTRPGVGSISDLCERLAERPSLAVAFVEGGVLASLLKAKSQYDISVPELDGPPALPDKAD